MMNQLINNIMSSPCIIMSMVMTVNYMNLIEYICIQEVDDEVDTILDMCSKHLKMSKIQFCNVLSTLGQILEDQQFLDQMCKINDDIYKLGVDENNNNESANYNISG